MIEQFETIQEMEAARGIPGDTIEEVRAKGFSIYEDANPKLRRPNTLVLYGNDALAAVGMGVSAPPLQKPEEIKADPDFTRSSPPSIDSRLLTPQRSTTKTTSRSLYCSA